MTSAIAVPESQPAVPGLLQSQTIGKLAAALSKAQDTMEAPGKGREAKIESQKGRYSYKYADLADIIDCYRKPLSSNGLALTQPIVLRGSQMVLLTVLVHESGEWIASEYPLRMYERPQEQGSAITYARRYAVSSLLGIAAEDDDDGKRAQDAEPPRQGPRPLTSEAIANGTVTVQEGVVDGGHRSGSVCPTHVEPYSLKDGDPRHCWKCSAEEEEKVQAGSFLRSPSKGKR